MALEFQRRLAIPVWAAAFFTVALTSPPTATLFPMPPSTVFAIAALGTAAIVFLMPQLMPWLRTFPARVRVVRSVSRCDPASAPIVVTAGTGMRKLDEANATEADDALDLVRMDDDGGWQMTRPAA